LSISDANSRVNMLAGEKRAALIGCHYELMAPPPHPALERSFKRRIRQTMADVTFVGRQSRKIDDGSSDGFDNCVSR
jgi:hypothetical protein